jgi:predicted Zn finger-like uncharacterized protein
MHITCERCGTVYTLDDRLIPVAGAPVQCTRCGNVFTAKPPQTGQTTPAAVRHTMVQFPAESATPPVNRPVSPADEASAMGGRTMMQFPAPVPAARDAKTIPAARPVDPSLGRTMMQFPAEASKPPADSRPAAPTPAPRPPPAKTTDEAKAAANRTLVQFPAITVPQPGDKQSPKTARFGAAPPAPNPPAPARPTAPPAGAPFFPAPQRPQQGSGPSGPVPASRGSDAMAKTILGAPAFAAPPLPVFEPPTPIEEPSESEQEFEAQLKARSRRPLIFVVILILLAAAVGAFIAIRNRPPPIPQVAVRDREEALRLLKRDDTESLLAAADRFAQISLQYPIYTPPLTDRVVALALLEADLREQMHLLEARYNKLDHERDSIERKAETEDWRARVQEKLDAMKAIKAKADPLADKAADLAAKLNEQLKQATQAAHAQASEDPAIARTAAIHYALKGDVRAEKDAETYRRLPDANNLLDDPQHAFADLAMALLAAYGPHNEERVAKGRKAAHDALAKDSSLIRAQFALAKIALSTKEYSEAKSALDALFIQSPKHDAGLLLREEIEAAEAADAALKALHVPQ